MAYQIMGFLTQLAYLLCSAFSSQETIKLDSDYREVLQQPEIRMSGPDTYWFRNNIYMHRLFFGGCNLPNFNFNIPVIICHKTVQRNVKTIKDISKHEKIWSTQIYCLAVLFVKTPLPLESMNSWLPWRREPEQTKRPEIALGCYFLCTHPIWPNRDVSTVQWFLCSHLMHWKFFVSSFSEAQKLPSSLRSCPSRTSVNLNFSFSSLNVWASPCASNMYINVNDDFKSHYWAFSNWK